MQQGDLFKHQGEAIAHGCNCVGVMGAGVAGIVARKHPALKSDYRRLCKNGEFKPGGLFAYSVANNNSEENKRDNPEYKIVFNLATQYQPGANANIGYIEQALIGMKEYAEMNNINSIGIPMIGAGIGGLDWADVEVVCRKTFDTSEVELIVYYL